MDYVEWCERVLAATLDVIQQSTQARTFGFRAEQVAQAMFAAHRSDHSTFIGSELGQATSFALVFLEDVGLVERNESSRAIPQAQPYFKLTSDGREHLKDHIPLWSVLTAVPLEPEQQEVLAAVNHRSPIITDTYAMVQPVSESDLLADLGWVEGFARLNAVARELSDLQLVGLSGFLARGRLDVTATYRGLVWETRRKFTAESQYIDQLVTEWETTSVEFKRDVQLRSKGEEAEFVKDILGLVNTQASSPHLLVIGFDPKTHEYYGPPNPSLSQDWIERGLTNDTAPMVEAHYRIADYRKGPVGIIEVVRDPKKLPYRVARTLGDKSQGDKKHIVEGEVFVRHGSQTEEPTPAELAAIIAEGKRARDEPVSGLDT